MIQDSIGTCLALMVDYYYNLTLYLRAPARCRQPLLTNSDVQNPNFIERTACIALAQNVSRFDLVRALHVDIYYKLFTKPGTVVCLPKTCSIYLVKEKQNCNAVAEEVGDGLTAVQVRDWNPNVDSMYSNLGRLERTVMCVSPLNSTNTSSSTSGDRGKWLQYTPTCWQAAWEVNTRSSPTRPASQSLSSTTLPWKIYSLSTQLSPTTTAPHSNRDRLFANPRRRLMISSQAIGLLTAWP